MFIARSYSREFCLVNKCMFIFRLQYFYFSSLAAWRALLGACQNNMWPLLLSFNLTMRPSRRPFGLIISVTITAAGQAWSDQHNSLTIQVSNIYDLISIYFIANLFAHKFMLTTIKYLGLLILGFTQVKSMNIYTKIWVVTRGIIKVTLNNEVMSFRTF